MRTYDFVDPEMSSAMIAANSASTVHLAGLPISCLEIGVYDGRSACWLLDNRATHSDATYTGVDYIGDHAAAHERAKLNLERNHTGKYTLLIGDSLVVVPKLVTTKPQYDIIHVDGCHSYRGCLGDLTNCWPLLKPGGVIVCDDYDRADYGVGKAVHEFLSTLQVAKDYRIVYVGYAIAWAKLGTVI